MSRPGGVRRMAQLVWPHRRGLTLAFLCMAVLAGANGLYAYLTGPLLTFLLGGPQASSSQALGRLGAYLPMPLVDVDRSRALLLLPALIVVIALVKGAAYLGQFYLMGMVGQATVADLRRALFRKLLGLSPAWHERHHSGDLLSRFTADVASVELFATYGVAAVLRDTTQLAVLLLVLFSLDWKLASIGLVLVPLCAAPVSRLAQRLRQQMRLAQDALGKLGARVQEGLWGHRIIQTYGIRDRELARFDLDSDRYVDQMTQAIRERTATPAILEWVVVAALSLVLASAWHSDSLPPALLVSFMAGLAMLYQPAKDLGRVSPWLLQATAGAERIFEILDTADPVADVARGPAAPAEAFRELRLEGIDLSYRSEEKQPVSVLRGLELQLGAGERIGLVGASGGGKSTVVKLLLRFLDPDRGRVAVNGQDAREMPLAQLRRNFALVTQEPLLFSDTVGANIAYARPGASLEEIRSAARVANAEEFIERLPQGYATAIGERGVRLSGGQKQRLALARAVLAEAPVLVLDEATSSLDAESEREVQDALDRLLVGRTALIIAHRLSAVRRATRICVLEEGRIVEQGTHEELQALGGRYSGMAALQTGVGKSAAQEAP